MSKRDTQFAGFAKRLMQDLHGYDWEGVELIIAQRAYDLVAHTIEHIELKDLDVLEYRECVQRIPDMPAWPEDAS